MKLFFLDSLAVIWLALHLNDIDLALKVFASLTVGIVNLIAIYKYVKSKK